MSTALATQRLRLRLPAAGDTSAAAELLTDPEVMRFLGREEVPEERVGAVVEKWIRRWEENGIGFFVVESCEDGAFLGRVGLNVWDVRSWTHATRAAAREYAQPELGWALVRSQWGRGYAAEAALAVRDWAFNQRDIRRLISLIAPDNLASAAVASPARCPEPSASGDIPTRWPRRRPTRTVSALVVIMRLMESHPKLVREEVEALVALHTERIADLVPEGRTSISGSTLLGTYGGHDVDLVVLVSSVEDAAERIRRSYPPLYEDDWRDDWAAFRLEGPPQVDIVVTKQGTTGDAHHRRAWELILADPRLQAEYEMLKATGMDSVRKAEFFNSVVAMLPLED
jgi:RimJ/RimL family protein N-acetyltransferase